MKAIARVSIFIVSYLALVGMFTPVSAAQTSTSLGEKVDAYIMEIMHRFPMSF